jgi:hypothetical protein
MALGDGIRRNIATVSTAERNRFRDAIIALNQKFFPGSRTDFPAGHVSYWFKQDEIHQATHVHGGPAFLPWHRELCNRFEAMLREVDADLSLHYWDWTTDPASLFTNTFMGGANGDAGAPWQGGGLYDPGAPGDAFRDDTIHGLNKPTSDPSGWSYALHANPADPPKTLTRDKDAGAPPIGTPGWPSESDIVTQTDFAAMRAKLEEVHNSIHGYIGGTIGNAHTSFRDPFVFLLHSNVDRLFAMWQTQPGHSDRLDPNHVYDPESADPAITNPLEPWSGSLDWPVRPWFAPENEQVVKNCKHASVVRPPCYDTLPIFPPTVSLETASVNFNDVPEGETAARAIVFSAVSCHDVHLSITAGPTVLTGPPATSFGTLLGTSVAIPHISSATPPRGRLWLSYKGTAAGDTATGTVTVHCTETNEDFEVPIAANTIARPTVAVMLTLDQSGSMDWLAGIDASTKRIDVLHQAAANFVQLLQRYVGDGVGMVSFDQDSYPGAPVTKYNGGPFDLLAVSNAIQALHPQGATSIGKGLTLARNTLNPVTGYDHKALIVFTDGLENTPPFIADVMSSINDRTFAIGLGTAEQVSTGALNALTNHTGGYLLLSGRLSPSIDDTFRLTKYFLEILAGVTNNNIVTDPSGYLAPGMKVRIPFDLNETDIDASVILLTDIPAARLRVETPEGDVMAPADAAAVGAIYEVGTNMIFYRFTLPLPLGAKPAHEGRWYALLEVDRKVYGRLSSQLERFDAAAAAHAVHGIKYTVTVQSYSNLRMTANVSQNSLEPGAKMTLRAHLSEYGIPVDHRASMQAEIERPDGSHTTMALNEIEPGFFEAATTASLEGVYRFHATATGVTQRGLPFTREQLLTAAAFRGGDSPWPTSDPSKADDKKQLCELLNCLLQPHALGRLLAEHHIDEKAVRACINRWCKPQQGKASEDELREREGTATVQPEPAAVDPVASQAIAILTKKLDEMQQSISAAQRRSATPAESEETSTEDEER